MLRINPIDDPTVLGSQFERGVSIERLTDKCITGPNRPIVVPRADAHVRYIIDLSLPCINSVLCGSTYRKAAKVLGEKGETIAALADFSMCVDKETGECIPVNNCTGEGSDYLFNGQALEYLIDKLEPKKSICGILHSLFKVKIGNARVTFELGSGDMQVYGNWYLQMLNYDTSFKLTDEDIAKTVDKALKIGKLDRVNMLTNMLNSCGGEQEVRDYLSRMWIYRHVPVMPLNTRPSLNTQLHPLTAAYKKLYNHNNDWSVYKNAPFETYKDYYKTLFSYVNTIVCQKSVQVSSDNTMNKVMPLLDIVKGKTGIIRSKMLKKRQDYSGRAAVVADPFMPLNTIGVPESIIPKLYRLHAVKNERLHNIEIIQNLNSSEYDATIVKELKRDGTLSLIPVTLGRNPTLHKHGIQGFYIKPVPGRALRVSPLPCPAFNMDFDGDAGHVEIPLSPTSAEEVRKLVMTDKNILLPKTGESTISPRMDVLYGLYMCTKSEYKKSHSVATYETPKELRDAIYCRRIKVSDTITLTGYGTNIAGVLAFESCLPKSVVEEVGPTPEITAGTIKPYVKLMEKYMGVSFNNTIDTLVELGFKVAYLYCCSVSMLRDLYSDTDKSVKFDSAFQEFHNTMDKIDELNDFGFYDLETYTIEYGKAFDAVQKALKGGVFDKIKDNMFTRMAKAGARGNESNLVQIFGAKGRIQKSSDESFNVVIENGLRAGLTPTEHAIAGIGARLGQIAKSIKTADTGYFERKAIHAAASIVIKSKDCGTKEGITIKSSDIFQYLVKEEMTEADMRETKEKSVKIMKRFITGRYTTNGALVSDKLAEFYADLGEVEIRSPLKCKDPCCVKCYGKDPGTGSLVKVGTPVGILAAMSLAEPSTQLTLKVFQKGGVDGGASSSFDRLLAVLQQSDIRTDAMTGKYPTYDPVAWAPGTLVSEEYSGRRVILKIVPDNDTDTKKYDYSINRVIPEGIALKVGQHVEVGDSLRIVRGDTYVPELAAYCGIYTAALQMVYNIYFLFVSECDLVPVHIDTIVSSLIGYKPKFTDNNNLKLGKYYTKEQLCRLGQDYSNTTFKIDIRGMLTAITDNVNFMESLIMEDPRAALSDAVCNCLTDMMDSPLVQVAFGMYAEVGTRVNPNYMEE